MTDFIDSATITSITSLSAVEVAAGAESNTLSGKTTPSSSENANDLDTATVSGKTTLGSIEERDQYDASTVSSVTSLGYVEVTATERLIVAETYTGLAVGDTVDFVVSVTTTTTTSTGGTPPTDIIIGVSVTTTDYNNQPWIAAYSYDSGAAITAGTQASFDEDDGLLEVATV